MTTKPALRLPDFGDFCLATLCAVVSALVFAVLAWITMGSPRVPPMLPAVAFVASFLPCLGLTLRARPVASIAACILVAAGFVALGFDSF